jgi:hypothetical protein
LDFELADGFQSMIRQIHFAGKAVLDGIGGGIAGRHGGGSRRKKVDQISSVMIKNRGSWYFTNHMTRDLGIKQNANPDKRYDLTGVIAARGFSSRFGASPGCFGII